MDQPHSYLHSLAQTVLAKYMGRDAAAQQVDHLFEVLNVTVVSGTTLSPPL